MHVNAKMISIKTVSGMGGRIKKNNEEVKRVNSTAIYLIHCKNFCKCHDVPHPAQQSKTKQKKWGIQTEASGKDLGSRPAQAKFEN
jgi:hypothetical protein